MLMVTLNLRTVLSCAIAAAFSYGCSSLSSLQTGRTLKEDESSFVFGAGSQSIAIDKKSTEPEAKKIEESIKDVSVPLAEFGYRRGVMKNLEAGVNWTLPGTLTASGKYMLLGHGTPYALSLGTGIGYSSVELGKNKMTLIDFSFPVYTSYDLTEDFSVYLNPKYLLRLLQAGKASDTGHLIGVTGGLAYRWFFVEYGTFLPQTIGDPRLAQITVGISTGWDKTEK